jgi:hypothetical protein
LARRYIGKVIAVDNSEAYMAKLFGPRIRILVRDLKNLPQSVILPRLDEEGVVKYKVEYSGLPSQCGRCRSTEHIVRFCLKRDSKTRKETYQRRPNPPIIREEKQKGTALPEEDTQGIETINIGGDKSPKTTTEHTNGGEDPSPKPEATNTLEPDRAAPPFTEDEDLRQSPRVVSTEESTLNSEFIPELQPNETNFPQLVPQPTSPELVTPIIKNRAPSLPEENTPTQAASTPPEAETASMFIWRRKDKVEEQQTTKGKEKMRGPDSAPITRQGYRSGRLADDFWVALNVPDTPHTTRKKLRVISFLTKNKGQAEYLIENSTSRTITTVHIAEQLAGVPWTTLKARQHIVNEVA